MKDYRVGRLPGRLADGFESDTGSFFHAVVQKRMKRPPCPYNDFGKKIIPDDNYTAPVALCGAKPGRRSVGWSFDVSGESHDRVTCPRCLKKMQD